MQASISERLRNEWGDTICHHPMLDIEYNFGSKTGNFACLICGAAVSAKKDASRLLFHLSFSQLFSA